MARTFRIRTAWAICLFGCMALTSLAFSQDNPKLRAYPNPVQMGGRVQIDYWAPQAGKVEIELFDLTGRRIVTLINSRLDAGRNQLTWTAANRFGKPLTPGTYRLSLRSSSGHAEQKLVIVP